MLRTNEAGKRLRQMIGSHSLCSRLQLLAQPRDRQSLGVTYEDTWRCSEVARSTVICVEPSTSARRLSSLPTYQILPSTGRKLVRSEQPSNHHSNDLQTEPALDALQ
jgi:hypothetical protein